MRSPEAVMKTYLEEVALQGRLELIDEIAQPDMIDEANQIFGGPPGKAGLVAHVRGFNRHIGNCSLRIEKIVADEQEAMAWWTFTGQHVGPWLGKPATNQPVEGTVFSFFEMRDGLIDRYRLCLSARFCDELLFFDTSQERGGLKHLA